MAIARCRARFPADTIEIEDAEVRRAEIDGVVGRTVADARPLLGGTKLPLGGGSGVVGSIRPVTLLQAEHGQAGLDKPFRDYRSRNTGADDEDIGRFPHHEETH